MPGEETIYPVITKTKRGVYLPVELLSVIDVKERHKSETSSLTYDVVGGKDATSWVDFRLTSLANQTLISYRTIRGAATRV